MANWYVNSAVVGGAANGTSWANAWTALSSASAAAAAGDTIFLANTHNESGLPTTTWAFAGTTANPIRVLCAAPNNTPPVSADLVPASGSTTPTHTGVASIATTNAANLIMTGIVNMRGVALTAGSGSTGASSFTIPGGTFELCSFNANFTGGGPRVVNSGTVTDYLNCEFIGLSTSVFWTYSNGNGFIRFRGSGTKFAQSGSVGNAPFIMSSARVTYIDLDGVDLSAYSGKTLISTFTGTSGRATLRNCKLPATVTIIAAGPGTWLQCNVDVLNCDSGAGVYRNERYDYAGTLTTETANVRNAGATDSVTPISWKVTTTTGAKLLMPFELFEIDQWWGGSVGVPHTASIAICNSALNLTGADVWVEAEYLGSATSPLGAIAYNNAYQPADPLATGAAWPIDGTAPWTANPSYVQQTLLVTFTPQQVGYVRFKIKVARPSTTLWIDPLVVIT